MPIALKMQKNCFMVTKHIGPVMDVGDPQERQHFHGRLHHKKTLFLGLRYVAEERISNRSGDPYLRMAYSNGLFGSISCPSVEIMCGWRPNTMPKRMLYSLMDSIAHADWLALVESSAVKWHPDDDTIYLQNRLIDLQHGDQLKLFSEIYGRP